MSKKIKISYCNRCGTIQSIPFYMCPKCGYIKYEKREKKKEIKKRK